MSDTFKIRGDYLSQPSSGNPSAYPTVSSPIDETLVLSKTPLTAEYVLTADAAQDVAFGHISNAHVVIIKTVGGKVRVRLTSADGSQQSIPVDSLLVLISQSVPFTALDLTRVTGVQTNVKVLLGERAQ